MRPIKIKSPRKRQPESRLKKAISDYLKLKGLLVIPLRATGIWRKDTGHYIPYKDGIGLPDLLIVDKGHAVFLEIKSVGGKQSPAQLEMQQKIEKAGAVYRVLHSVDEVILLFP